MNKSLKWIIIGVATVLVLGYIGLQVMQYQTKKLSPEDTVVYDNGYLNLEIFYNRPYKKGRTIFGDLVPYNETWRTGANEQTTFTTNKNILVDGSLLEAGEYSLFTVPKEESWEIVFNNRAYSWGADWQTGKAPRIEKFDELVVEVPVNKNFKVTEQFTIDFKESENLILVLFSWDDVVVSLPITSAK